MCGIQSVSTILVHWVSCTNFSFWNTEIAYSIITPPQFIINTAARMISFKCMKDEVIYLLVTELLHHIVRPNSLWKPKALHNPSCSQLSLPLWTHLQLLFFVHRPLATLAFFALPRTCHTCFYLPCKQLKPMQIHLLSEAYADHPVDNCNTCLACLLSQYPLSLLCAKLFL